MLVVGFRSRDYILRCLRAAMRSADGESCEFLFHDCSDDGSAALVASELPMVRVIPHLGNLGFGGGNNALAQHARGSRFLLLNPDAFADGDQIAALIRTARRNSDAVAWGGVPVGPDGSADSVCGDRLPSLARLAARILGFGTRARLPEGRATIDVESLSGAFMMVDADAWRAIGGFDTRFFLYAEELDLCKRLLAGGDRMVLDLRCSILHDTGGGERRSPTRFVNRARGNATYMRKHWGPLGAEIGCALQLLHAAARLVLACPGTPGGRGASGAARRNSLWAVLRERQAWWDGWPQVSARQEDPHAPTP